MHALRLIAGTAAAAVLTVFAVHGMVRFLEGLARPLVPSPIAVSKPSLDFGTVPLHGSEEQEIVVRNDGPGPLHARFVVWGSACRVEPDELILQPGVEWSIRIEARPSRPGPIEDVLTIQVLGGGIAPVAIPLAGVAGETGRPSDPGGEINRV